MHGKVDDFIGPAFGSSVEVAPQSGDAQLVHDALAMLTMLGEPRLQARRLIDRVLTAGGEMQTADAIVAAAYRLKEEV